MVIINQGVAIQPGFSSKTTCSFENRPIGCVYKTRTKYASKDEIELAVLKAFREVLIEVLSSVFGVTELVPRSHRDLRRTQASTQSRKRNKGFIVGLESGTIKIWPKLC